MTVLISPHLHQHEMLLVCKCLITSWVINSILLILIWLYFINDEVGHLYKSLLSICIYSVSLCVDILWQFSYYTDFSY